MEANITLIPSTSNQFFHRLLDYCRKQRVHDAYTLSPQTDTKLKCKSMARTKMLISGCKWNTQWWNDFNIISTKGPQQLLRSSHFLIKTLEHQNSEFIFLVKWNSCYFFFPRDVTTAGGLGTDFSLHALPGTTLHFIQAFDSLRLGLS